MKYNDLRDFIAQLEQRGDLVRVKAEGDPVLEITAAVQDQSQRRVQLARVNGPNSDVVFDE